MSNKEWQSDDTEQAADTTEQRSDTTEQASDTPEQAANMQNNDRYTYESGHENEQARQLSNTEEYESAQPQADTSEPTSAGILPGAASGGAYGSGAAGAAASGNGRGNAVWITISAILAVALIIILVVKPQGGSSSDSVATVNGAAITKDQLYDAMIDYVGTAALDNLILEELVSQEATAASVTVSEADIDFEVDTIRGYYPSEEEFQAALKQNNYTIDKLRDDMKLNVMIRKVLEPRTNVTDESIQEYYDANKYSLGDTPIEVQASHILVDTQEEADSILAELKNGADFAELAKAKSKDGSASVGGDLGFFQYGQMIPEFSKAAFELEINEISEVVPSQYGFHIIKKTDVTEGTVPTFDEKKDDIRTLLVGQETQTLSSAWLEEIRTKATITNTLADEAETSDNSDNAAAAE